MRIFVVAIAKSVCRDALEGATLRQDRDDNSTLRFHAALVVRAGESFRLPR
jgi:hypothetical protein